MSRAALLWLAFAAMALVLLGLLAGPLLAPPGAPIAPDLAGLDAEDRAYAARLQQSFATAEDPAALSPASLALVDGLALWTVALFASATLIPQSLHARIRALATPLLCLLVLVLSIVVILAALAALMAMLTLFLAVPFGTIVYLAIFGTFATGGVLASLAFATLFRFAALVCLALSSWRFLQNKTLIALIATGYGLALLSGLVFAWLPGLLHAIADAALAIGIGIVAAIWSLILFLRSIPGLRTVLASG